MGRARSAIAVRASADDVKTAALKAFSYTVVAEESFDEFYDVAAFCRPRSEELGGDEGMEAWYLWSVKDWTILGDLSQGIARNVDALEALSAEVGNLVVCGIDPGFEYACFAAVDGGRMKRLLVLEDDEIVEDGFPVPAEQGSFIEDFSEEEAERLWTSYGLPTFDHDPLDGPFACLALQRA